MPWVMLSVRSEMDQTHSSKFSMKLLSHFAKLHGPSIHSSIPPSIHPYIIPQSQVQLLSEGSRIAVKSKDMGSGAALSS